MKKALICPNELVQLPDGEAEFRIAQVEPANRIFAVADPLFWVDCDDAVVADRFTYNLFTKTITAIPVPTPPAPIGDAPTVIA